MHGCSFASARCNDHMQIARCLWRNLHIARADKAPDGQRIPRIREDLDPGLEARRVHQSSLISAHQVYLRSDIGQRTVSLAVKPRVQSAIRVDVMLSSIDANTRITFSQQVFLRPKSQVPVLKRTRTEARRTVRQGAGSKNGPNWVLDEPKRLWEIGSRYWYVSRCATWQIVETSFILVFRTVPRLWRRTGIPTLTLV